MSDTFSQSNLTGGKELPSGTRLEEFMIERVLGSGGFGITYLARDLSLNRQIVIKENLPSQFAHRDTSSLVVKPGLGREDEDNFRWSMENFSREAEMLASLSHPGIVSVLRRFETLGTAYFVMPFVEGVAFDELITQRHSDGKPFTEEELHGLLERTLSALDHLHQRGIYHRDIKPGNILITNDGIPVLIDFGSARQRIGERSMTVIESPGYTPFEQLQSRGNVGPWSDLYALGGTLCKAITGSAPPKANDRAFDDPFVPLAERPELKATYSASFLRCLDRSLGMKPTDRWQDAGEWLAALREPAETSAITGQIFPASTPRPEPKSMLKSLPYRHAPTSAFHTTVVSRMKSNLLPWVIAAFLMLGIFLLAANISGNKEEAAAAKIQEAKKRDYQAEIEKEDYIALAKAKEKEASKEAERERAAQREAKEQADAKAAKQMAEERAAQAEREKEEFLIAQAKVKEEEAAKEADRKKRNVGSKAGEEREFEIAPGMSMTFCWIPPGEFMMGSPEGEVVRRQDETQHPVKISKGFWLAKTETTQAQWRAVMGSNPSRFKGEDLPVETVSWDDIADPGGFIEKVNQTAAVTEGRFHLPTEAHWEYACRAGTISPYAGDLDQMAWYDRNSGGKTQPVGTKKANAWGLHDMHGNVWEWCADVHGAYPEGATSDPSGPVSGTYRVFRGGSWDYYAGSCRAAFRGLSIPVRTIGHVGFRVARSSVP
jgi:formylglycine-generating enzyme required for sulfatase activity/serine/threonine protein kinase